MAYRLNKPKSENKPIHIVLVSILAFIAVTILAIWLAIGYMESRPVDQEEPTNPTTTPDDTITDAATCLLVLDTLENKRFVLIQTDPVSEKVIITPVPTNLINDNNSTLTDLFTRYGPVRVMQTVSHSLELPIDHYISLDSSGINKFMSELDNGITVNLVEAVTYTDENGITVTLKKGEQNLTAGQATAVLSNSSWKQKDHAEIMITEIIQSLVNSYMTSGYSLRGYFGVLSNVAQTDLRIDHFTAYAPALSQLAENNSGHLAVITSLAGEDKDGFYIPDIDACRKNTKLYH